MRKDVAAIVKMIPDEVKIGGHIWNIILLQEWAKNEKEENCWGGCSPNGLSLTVANLAGTPSPSIVVDTLLHEVLHAVWYNQGLNNGKVTEESAVSGLTAGLMMLFKDNPWLLDVIKKGAK